MLLLPYVTGTNLRRIAHPHFVPCRRGHLHKPLTVPRGLHSNPSRCRQLPIKSLGFSRPMLQLLLALLSRHRVQPTNLLPTGMVIASYNHHRRLLPTESFGSPNRSILGYRTEPSLLSNQLGLPNRTAPHFVGGFDAQQSQSRH